ncbi:DUF2489 domain-containing protein [Neiella marina]|uniref:DUF2489 domain-containing protein n=1 Tax=Neiella holothuriorum TaxID=2870530 RepID=A0ABS7ECL3_9GAMM|nr:DUF2489 domain-containing protein [Neiella holothuriorum]MBW8190068.1 DUF2489 domain-containing protein [Neiella holothuriorum]
MTVQWILLALASAIIAGLAIYAGKLLWQLYQQQQTQRQRQAQAIAQKHQQIVKKNKSLWQSIDTICRAAQQGQCCTSEAAIRLCVLLGHLHFDGEQPNLATRFPGIHGLHAAIKHHPTHDARKSYSKKEIRKLDQEREQFEQEFEAQVQHDLHQLLLQDLPLIA